MDKPITLCDRCDIYMSCLLNYDGPACRRSRTVEPTNYDRIISKSAEYLAAFIAKIADCDECEDMHGYRMCDAALDKDCEDCWLEWLRKEAEA